jgi:succinoglycan biosynthesis protein ExoM
MNVSVCIATYRRPERLGALLDDLVLQQQLPYEVVVVDNDAAGSARVVIEHRQKLGAPFPIHYAIQPEKNIARTRNRTVQLASGEWLAFIDDDERAPAGWLKQLTATVTHPAADGALGPVVPVVPAEAPAWIQRGRFYDWQRLKTGTVVPPNKLRFGNVLLRAALLRVTPEPFDPSFGLTGGEDGDLLGRLAQEGARIVWCDEAIVHEPVDPARLSLRWLLLRALRGGQDFARHRLNGRFGKLPVAGRARLFGRALLQAVIALTLTLLTWPAGRDRAAYWLLKSAANVGKMSIFFGWHYREYAGAGR